MKTDSIKRGDLVTLPLSENFSNTYRVLSVFSFKKRKLAILEHPLSPECAIIKDVAELNTAMGVTKSPLEHCLKYINNHRSYLGYMAQADLDSLIYYLVVKRELTPRQKDKIATLAGKVAGIKLNHNLASAANIVSNHYALLDDYSKMLYRQHKEQIENIDNLATTIDRSIVYRLAAVILAQLNESGRI
jgi:hypothetical protein